MPQRGRAGSAPQVSNPLRFRTDVFLLSDVHLYSSARKTQTARILTHRKGSLKHRHFLLVAFRIFAPAARGLRKCGAVRLRPSTVPVLCPAKPGLVLRVWPACLRKTAKRRVCDASRAAYARIGQPTHQSAQRGRSGARKSSRCTVRQEPASHHGTNRLIRGTVRRSTTVGNAVPFRGCPQLLAGGRLGALSSHAVRVLRFRPRRPPPLLRAHTAVRVLSSRRPLRALVQECWTTSRGALPEHRARPGQRSVPVHSCVGLHRGEF